MVPHFSLLIGTLPGGISVFILALLVALWYQNRREAAQDQLRMNRTLRLYCAADRDRAA